MLGNTIGKNMKRIREELHLNQDFVAKKLNVRRQTLSAYECGRNMPNIYTLIEISRLYHVTLDELTGNDQWKK